MALKIGGQAVIEGVMMRAPHSLTIAVRNPQGEIVVKNERLTPLSEKWPALKKPLLRGIAALIQSLTIGVKALNYSANIALEGETDKKGKQQEIGPLAMTGTLLLSLGLGVALFFMLPLAITNFLKGRLPLVGANSIFFNLADGIIRVAIFIAYLSGVSLMKDIKRLFEYHGAEHKAVFTYEAGRELILSNTRGFTTLHPRCGTSFLLTVMVISILVFSLIPHETGLAGKALYRVVFLPLIAGLSFEINRLGAEGIESPILKALLAPGLWLQKMTAREPSDDQIEVALRALQEAIAMEEGIPGVK